VQFAEAGTDDNATAWKNAVLFSPGDLELSLVHLSLARFS
jgi:hypothetical protein